MSYMTAIAMLCGNLVVDQYKQPCQVKLAQCVLDGLNKDYTSTAEWQMLKCVSNGVVK